MLTVMTACYHEAGHSVVALRFGLPLARVIVRDDGTGRTSYRHWLGAAEIERWIVTTYAGGEAEADKMCIRDSPLDTAALGPDKGARVSAEFAQAALVPDEVERLERGVN